MDTSGDQCDLPFDELDSLLYEPDTTLQENNTSSNSKRKGNRTVGRGPGKQLKSSTPMILDFDQYDLPCGDFEKQYGTHLGRAALRVDINIRDWSKVDQELVDILWIDTQKLFHINDPTGSRKKNFVRALAARFRQLKSRLVDRFITKKSAPPPGNPNANKKPWQVYDGYITEEQWKLFEAYVESDEFKKISERGKQCSKGNIHRHHLGQKSYTRKRKEWIKEKRLPPPTADSSISGSSSLISENVENRALEWCLAHKKRTKDGTWETNPKPETARVVSQVLEHLEKEKEKGVGSTTSEQGMDALSIALGKKDYRGYVKGLGRHGVGVGYRKAFGGTQQKRAYTQEDFEIRLQEMSMDFEARLQQMSKEFDKRLKEGVQAHLAMLSNMPTTNRSISSTNPPLQPLTVKELKKCKVAVNDEDGNLVVVAESTAHPIHDGVVHISQAHHDHYKVTIDKVLEDHGSVLLPVAPEENITKLGEAYGYFILWPRSMVIFEDEDSQTCAPKKKGNSKSKEVADSWYPRTEESDVHIDKNTSADVDDNLTEECSLLDILLVEEKKDTWGVSLKAPLLYSQTDTDIWVTSTDIAEFLRGEEINVSIIHVYILFLAEEFISSMQRRNITFLCPQRISAAECTRSFF